ncbi:hypothetical protein P3G55_23895, partial [Leptospira sp. 96542]|nr:hypothetical protein [Leptospira sp. 96542]
SWKIDGGSNSPIFSKNCLSEETSVCNIKLDSINSLLMEVSNLPASQMPAWGTRRSRATPPPNRQAV